MRYIVFCFLQLLAPGKAHSQQVEILHQGAGINLRGISLYDNTIWVSGAAGTVGRSADAGKTWQWYIVKGYEKTDFRDVEAIDDTTAIIMGIASPAYILKTTDAGNSWQLVYRNKHPDMFLDAMSFTTTGKGTVIGDAVNGNFFIATTTDGNNWCDTSQMRLPVPTAGEAFFAASGTNIVWLASRYYIVSGGMQSRLFTNGKTIPLPMRQGRLTGGANSVAVYKNRVAIAGGDFSSPADRDSVFIISRNGGRTWRHPVQPPTGYRSCVCFANKRVLVACGLNGVDISTDGGMTWKYISGAAFNSCVFHKKLNWVFLTGNNSTVGRIAL